MGTRYFALICGVFFILFGIAGLVPLFIVPAPTDDPAMILSLQYGYLFGLFPVNILGTLFHLGIGVAGIYAFRSFRLSKIFAQALALVFLGLAFAGIVPGPDSTFGFMPVYGNDVFLHGVWAVFAGLMGFGSAEGEVAVTQAPEEPIIW